MKTQIKQWGTSKVLVLPTDFMNFHNADVDDWVDLSDCIVIGKDAPKKRQLENLKENFPSAYNYHIKKFPEDKLLERGD